jgi:hypothetical protein
MTTRRDILLNARGAGAAPGLLIPSPSRLEGSRVVHYRLS